MSFNIVGYIYFQKTTSYLMPLLLLIIPIIIQKKINLKLSANDAIYGFVISFISIGLFVLIKILDKGTIEFTTPTIQFIIITIIAVALPEEVFFRGFILHNIGCNTKGIVISSLLFAIAHGHRLFFFGDYLAILTLFPSLIMGFLYVRTNNILPSVIFHSLSNIVMFMIM